MLPAWCHGILCRRACRAIEVSLLYELVFLFVPDCRSAASQLRVLAPSMAPSTPASSSIVATGLTAPPGATAPDPRPQLEVSLGVASFVCVTLLRGHAVRHRTFCQITCDVGYSPQHLKLYSREERSISTVSPTSSTPTLVRGVYLCTRKV